MAAPVVTPTDAPYAFDPQSLRGRAKLWLPLAAGPVLWSVAEVASYWVVQMSCAGRWLLPDHPEAMPTRLVVGAIGLVALVLVGLSARAGWRRWDRQVDEQAPGQPYGDRQQFIALITVVFGVIFSVAILFHTLTPVFLPPCTAVPQ